MSAAFTPGPWEIRRALGTAGSVTGGVSRKYSNGSAQDQLFMVCSVQPDNGGPEAQEANARLIAAAPCLLSALQALFDDYKALADSGDAGNWRLEDQAAGKQALAAIARATGSAS